MSIRIGYTYKISLVVVNLLLPMRTYCNELVLLCMNIGFVVVIMRSDIDTGKRGMTSFILIGCEMSWKYIAYKKDLVWMVTDSRKCGCPLKLQAKRVLGGEGWMVMLICETHNHALDKLFIGHPYVGRLTEDENIIICYMIKLMVKPKNILLTLKEYNSKYCTTMKQVYNPRYVYRYFIRGNNSEMQQLMKLLECDQYTHWHILGICYRQYLQNQQI